MYASVFMCIDVRVRNVDVAATSLQFRVRNLDQGLVQMRKGLGQISEGLAQTLQRSASMAQPG